MRGARSATAAALGVLATCLLATSVAEAQLFPNLPIRRERVPCPEELPVYGLYRNKYYGYYPTCWRQFPPGWGCPNHESPDWEAELARQPLDIPDEEFGGYGGYGEEGLGGLGGPGGMEDETAPPLPERRSPFELDPARAPVRLAVRGPSRRIAVRQSIARRRFAPAVPAVAVRPPGALRRRSCPRSNRRPTRTDPRTTAATAVEAAPTAGPELAVLPEIRPPVRPASASATAAPASLSPRSTAGSRGAIAATADRDDPRGRRRLPAGGRPAGRRDAGTGSVQAGR